MTTTASPAHVVVVGAGLAGLAAATELSSHGVRVTIVEKNKHLGGKMNLLEDQGFSFDMGPTIITMPQVLRGILRRAGKHVEDHIDLRPLDPQWRCFYDDGTVIDLKQETREMAKALDAQFPDYKPGDGYRQFIEHSRRMFRLSQKVFFYKDLGAMTDMMASPPKDPGLLGDVLAMRLHQTVGKTAHSMIKEPHMQQLVEHFLQYVGSSPFLAPSILTLIASAQVDQGCWYPMGGTRMVARSLDDVLQERVGDNVELITGVGVKSILSEGARTVGVELEDGRRIEADAVVSNCDAQRTYRDLMSGPEADRASAQLAKKYEPACSGVVFYLGLDRQYDHLAHHNFLFSGDSHSEFDDIYKKGVPAQDPTLYLAAPSRTDPAQAPAGHEALYILIHTPYKRPGQTWRGEGGLLERYRPVIMDKLKSCGGMEDIENHIVVEHHLMPDDIESRYNAEGGAIYGLASHGRLAGGFKPRNRSRNFKGLYLAGGSANPGPGVPMVLMSGVTAARSVVEDLGMTTNDDYLNAVEDADSKLHDPQQRIGAPELAGV